MVVSKGMFVSISNKIMDPNSKRQDIRAYKHILITYPDLTFRLNIGPKLED
jgi:hypothetical protein